MKDLISKKIVKQIILKKSKADFQVREVYFPIFRKARFFFFRVPSTVFVLPSKIYRVVSNNEIRVG